MGVSRLSLTKPTIACISGYCLAGGLEVASWASLRVISQWSQLGVKCRVRGVPLIDGGTLRLPRLLGQSIASDLILTGRTIDGAETLRIGLANRLVPSVNPTRRPTSAAEIKADDDAVFAESLNLATLIASHPQDCMKK